jgi:N6-adenosine-specific RNA methylase IME4
MGRPATRKKGAYTRAEIQKRYRQRLKRARPAAKTLAKTERRAELERSMAERTLAANAALGAGGKRYGLIYADPPWRFEPRSRVTGMDRAADNHYPTMPLDDIKALPIPAAPDCVLYLWAPFSQLDNAMQLIRHWGFQQKTGHGWGKPDLGTGYIVRENLELLLIASRGKPVWPAPGENFPSLLIMAPRGEPSEKPEAFAEMIEQLWPNTPKLEMFARRRRDGWDSWGNEVA